MPTPYPLLLLLLLLFILFFLFPPFIGIVGLLRLSSIQQAGKFLVRIKRAGLRETRPDGVVVAFFQYYFWTMRRVASHNCRLHIPIALKCATTFRSGCRSGLQASKQTNRSPRGRSVSRIAFNGGESPRIRAVKLWQISHPSSVALSLSLK